VPADLAAFIRSNEFPCVGAKSALARNRLYALEAGDIRCPESDVALRQALIRFADQPVEEALTSFAWVFTRGAIMSEAQFESALWRRLQALHELDAKAGVAWDDDVSNDPASPQFSMSIGGTAYFVIGLHPGASRAARRFNRPALIFNLHDQFTRLKADGRYQQLQKVVRERDAEQNGDINPMVANFGDASEARQYSGRRVGDDWQCPFKAKTQ
jgi:FPC/CPF motif-containing protein YcgG